MPNFNDKAVALWELYESVNEQGEFTLDGRHMSGVTDFKYINNLYPLSTLVGAPLKVSRHYICSPNNLTNLIGAPKSLTSNGIFDCSDGKLISMEGAPTALGSFIVSNNQLSSLEHIPRQIERLLCLNMNKITSLRGVHKLVDKASIFECVGNPPLSHILGLVLIDNLSRVVLDDGVATNIINKGLKNKNGQKNTNVAYGCAAELVKRGLNEMAKL